MWACRGTEGADGGQVYSTANQMIHMVVGTSVCLPGELLLVLHLPPAFSAPLCSILCSCSQDQTIPVTTHRGQLSHFYGYAVPKVTHTLGSALLPPAADEGLYPKLFSLSRVC